MTDRYSCQPLQSVNILGETFAKLPFLLQQLQKIVPCSMLPIMSIFFLFTAELGRHKRFLNFRVFEHPKRRRFAAPMGEDTTMVKKTQRQ